MRDEEMAGWLQNRPDRLFLYDLQAYSRDAARLWALKSLVRNQPKEVKETAFKRANSTYEILKTHVVEELERGGIEYHPDQLFPVCVLLAERYAE